MNTIPWDSLLKALKIKGWREADALSLSLPSEQYTFNTAETLSIGSVQNFYKANKLGSFYVANCVCEISASPFVNWGAC